MSVLLLGKLSAAEYAAWRQHLSLHLPPGETLVLANQAYDKTAVDIALVANPPAGALATLPKLRFVQSLWAGVDRLLNDPSLPRGVPLARLVDPAMTRAMTECALANVFYLHRQLPTYLRQQRASPVATAAAGIGSGSACRSARNGKTGCGRCASPQRCWFSRGGVEPSTRIRWTDGVTAPNRHSHQSLAVDSADHGNTQRRCVRETTGGGRPHQPGARRAPGRTGSARRARAQHLSHAVLDVFNEEPLPDRHPSGPIHRSQYFLTWQPPPTPRPQPGSRLQTLRRSARDAPSTACGHKHRDIRG